MTVFSTGHGSRKEPEVNSSHISLDDLEGAWDEIFEEQDRRQKRRSTAANICSYFFFFVALFCILVVITTNSNPPPKNPNPSRLVHLNKSSGGYGLVLHGRRIMDIIIGGAAAQHGGITTNDEIQSINGVDVNLLRSSSGIDKLMETRPDNVELVVVAAFPETVSQRLHSELFIPFCISLCLTMLYAIADQCMEETVPTRTVKLVKENGEYGFYHSGPLITRVTPGGPADVQGCLQVGDFIESVNGVDVHNEYTQAISDLIKSLDEEVVLVVRG